MSYRKVTDITADELLDALTDKPQFQAALFVKLGGDPNDHKYAYLSYLTRELRERGISIASSRTKGIWLEEAA